MNVNVASDISGLSAPAAGFKAPWLVRIEPRDAASAEAGETSLFADLYDRHIAREEQELLPLSARLLGSSDLDRIGHAMRLRQEITST